MRFDEVLSPVNLFLAACGLVATLSSIQYEGKVSISGSFVCAITSATVLGPTAGMFVAATSELGVSAIERPPRHAVLANLAASVLPSGIAGLVFDSMTTAASQGRDYAAATAVAAGFALLAHVAIYAPLRAAADAVPVREMRRSLARILPVFGLTVPLIVGVTVTYRDIGAGASGAVLVVLLAFNYTASLLIEARDQRARAAALAAGRGRLVAQAVAAEERERRLLAERLHDHAMQSLLVAQQDLDDAAEGDPDALGRARDALSGAVGQLRGEVFELHPAVLEQNGLAAAIEAVAEKEGRRGGFAAKVSVDPEAAGLNDRLLFALARELLVNAARHAEASLVTVSITRVADDLVVEVCDDGSGIPAGRVERAVSEGHIGLASSRERVDALGGSFALDSAPGEGTTVRVSIPARAELPEPKLNERPMDGPGTVLAERKGQPRPV